MKKQRCASCKALKGTAHTSSCTYARRASTSYPDNAVYITVLDVGPTWSAPSCDTSSSDSCSSGGDCA